MSLTHFLDSIRSEGVKLGMSVSVNFVVQKNKTKYDVKYKSRFLFSLAFYPFRSDAILMHCVVNVDLTF